MPEAAASEPTNAGLPTRSRRWAILRVLLVAALGVLSVAFARLALPAAFLAFLAWLTLPSQGDRARRPLQAALIVGAIGSTVGLVRFVARDALPGMVFGGKEAAERAAVSHLREILFAEDLMRTGAHVDPDHDHIGSAGLLTEMNGTIPLRDGRTLADPTVNRRFGEQADTPLGPALQTEGYLFIVCLPTPDGKWTARPHTPIDDELAERRFVAYAWPASATRGSQHAFFIDEHERILQSTNQEPGRAGELRYSGPGFPPACDAALAPASRHDWAPWRGKQPRATLPGDHR